MTKKESRYCKASPEVHTFTRPMKGFSGLGTAHPQYTKTSIDILGDQIKMVLTVETQWRKQPIGNKIKNGNK